MLIGLGTYFGDTAIGEVYIYKDLGSHELNLSTNDTNREHQWEISETSASHGKFYTDITSTDLNPTFPFVVSNSPLYYIPEQHNFSNFTLQYKCTDTNGDDTQNNATITTSFSA